MDQQLDTTAGAMLRAAVQKMGIAVLTETSTVQVLGEDKVEGLVFKDGTTIPCEVLAVEAGHGSSNSTGGRQVQGADPHLGEAHGAGADQGRRGRRRETRARTCMRWGRRCGRPLRFWKVMFAALMVGLSLR